MITPQCIIIMGVSGCGKTTIGKQLAQNLGWQFYDADDFHPLENRLKMSQGVPLNDEDRAEWLYTLQQLIHKNIEERRSLVLACSALKQRYREILSDNKYVRFVYLRGSYEQIKTRLKRRKDHFMPVQLLQSQFEALEEPQDAFFVDISNSPEDIINLIRKGMEL